jgi:hypothetical protein
MPDRVYSYEGNNYRWGSEFMRLMRYIVIGIIRVVPSRYQGGDLQGCRTCIWAVVSGLDVWLGGRDGTSKIFKLTDFYGCCTRRFIGVISEIPEHANVDGVDEPSGLSNVSTA